MARFTDRNVIVTGGAQGIGRGIVEAFLAEGARVFAADILADGLERMRAETDPDRVTTHPVDLSDFDAAKAMVTEGIAHLGTRARARQLRRHDAGRSADRRVEGDVRPDLRGQHARADGDDAGRRRAHGRARRRRHREHRVARTRSRTSRRKRRTTRRRRRSSRSRRRPPTSGGICNIRANCVAPGQTITPEEEVEIAADPHEARLQREYLRRIPLQRAGVPRDQAMAVLFLASDDAAWISGQTLIVDGGELGGGDWYDPAEAPALPDE